MNSQSHSSNLILVGHCRGARGLSGEVRIFIKSGEAAWLKSIKEIVFEKLGQQTKFKVQNARGQGEEAWLRLEGVVSKTKADELKGAATFIDRTHFISKPSERYYLRELLDYLVMDGEIALGKVKGFDSNGPQDLLIVDFRGSDHLIPLVGDFIVKIDDKKKTIFMKLPSGLLELSDEV
ncbi:MAG: 16S rRNA processing protein RimM [Oligoflexia bacterium]|nr:16S rRNA processing protein RimM [Oligoflexia bacterium]